MTFTEDWFAAPSQHALAHLALQTEGVHGRVIEIGCWEGRSTIALARAVAPEVLHAVDTWRGSPGEISEVLAAERDVYATFLANMAHSQVHNVEVHHMGWRDYLAGDASPVRFAFIDAEHTYREVYDNVNALVPMLAPGAIICGDDQHHPPIRQAVEDSLGAFQVEASLWWVRP